MPCARVGAVSASRRRPQAIAAFQNRARPCTTRKAVGPARLARYTPRTCAVLYRGRPRQLGLAPLSAARVDAGPRSSSTSMPRRIPNWSLQRLRGRGEGWRLPDQQLPQHQAEPSFRVGCIGAITPQDMREAVRHGDGRERCGQLGIAQARGRLNAERHRNRRCGDGTAGRLPTGRRGAWHSGRTRLNPTAATRRKSAYDFIRRGPGSSRTGRLVLVTGISPTPAGEGKTTTTIGLGDALRRIGKSHGHLPEGAIARARASG